MLPQTHDFLSLIKYVRIVATFSRASTESAPMALWTIEDEIKLLFSGRVLAGSSSAELALGNPYKISQLCSFSYIKKNPMLFVS